MPEQIRPQAYVHPGMLLTPWCCEPMVMSVRALGPR